MVPRTFQARLTVAFVGVVALTLVLVSMLVLNRLDAFFFEQQRADLEQRAQSVAEYVELVAGVQTGGLRRVVRPDGLADPPVVASLSTQTQRRVLADWLGQADVRIVLGLPTEGGLVAASNGTVVAPLEAQPSGGQTREPLEVRYVHHVRNTVFPYVVEVTLSDPYTFRARAFSTLTGLFAAIGLFTLGLAIIVAAALARRITTPVRRLTEASRALAEGELGSRVALDQLRGGPAELYALGVQFNQMAERLEESVTIIRRDRDRSRDFLADVSHELRTPIAALRTFNELLKERAGDDPAARAEFLEATGQQIDRLDWLAQNLLELSKLDSGLLLLDLRPDDLRAVVESAVEQAEPAARRRGVELTASLPETPLRVNHDPQRIGQVVTNLVGNAIKFTPRGGSVTVTARGYRDGARIEVTDTGVGIDASELPRIFDRFYRGSRANEARGSGSGLGLAIVRSIVEMHGGTVAVESRLGAGSRFTVTLPRDPRTAETARPGRGTAAEDRDARPSARPAGGAPGHAPNVADSSPSEPSRLNPGTSP